MHVHAHLGPLGVVGLKEGALADDDLRLADIVAQQLRSRQRVAGVGQQRYLEVIHDLLAAQLHLLELLLGQPLQVLLELGALLDDHIADRGAGVLGVEGAEHDVVLELQLLLMLEGDQLVGRDLALEVAEPRHHAAHIVLDALVAHDGPRAHALEVALRAPVRQAAHMVHVPVGERTVLRGQRRARREAHIKADIHLGHVQRGGLARDRVALHTQRRQVQEAECPVAGRRFGNHGETPITAVSRWERAG